MRLIFGIVNINSYTFCGNKLSILVTGFIFTMNKLTLKEDKSASRLKLRHYSLHKSTAINNLSK